MTLGASARTALIRFSMLYIAVSVFCAASPVPMVRALLSLLWIFGPSAILIYGLEFVELFFIGTAVVFPLFFVASVVESKGKKLAAIACFSLAWALFGFLVYAPAA
jgi:hypothetical protein